ncbi:hypothetical protein BC629DRAFT_1435461 [Irpex lacteus]|nr:hypothetical protein BC629DRAFT_1435461 [Irpex lacteus]
MAHNATLSTAHSLLASVTASAVSSATSTAKAKAKTKGPFASNGVLLGYHAWWLYTGVIGAAIFLNIFSIFWAWKRRHALRRPNPNPSTKDGTSERNRSRGSGNGRISLRRLPISVLTASRIVAFRKRIPFVEGSLTEIVLSLAYFAALMGFALHDYSTPKVLQKKAGELVTMQFPLIVALAMKNNAIQLLTGISHEKLNYMHRTTSRAALVLTWTHAFALIAERAKLFRNTWRIVGLAAGIVQAVLTILSIKPIRKRFYEFFFLGHIILVFVFLVCACVHITGSDTRYTKLLWPCFLIWGVDRGSRYLRYLILSNFHSPNKSPATLELITPDAVRITVTRKFYGTEIPMSPYEGGWTPGKHMFLAFPTIGPIESHPFTIASVAEASESVDLATEKPVKKNEFELMWIVRVRDGFTKRLKEHILMKNQRQIELGTEGPLKMQLPIFMDGPYGAPPDISRFETCVFFGGGSGVAYTLPRMWGTLKEVAAGKHCAKRVLFVWAIRHSAHVKWILPELQRAIAAAPPGVELTVSIYVTTGCPEDAAEEYNEKTNSSTPDEPRTPDTIDVPVLEEQKSGSNEYSVTPDEKRSGASTPERGGSNHFHGRSIGLDYDCVRIYYGRPNAHEILEEAVTTSEGPVSVDVSGPEPLVASIRLALSAPFAGPTSVLKGLAPEVQLNVEEFTM